MIFLFGSLLIIFLIECLKILLMFLLYFVSFFLIFRKVVIVDWFVIDWFWFCFIIINLFFGYCFKKFVVRYLLISVDFLYFDFFVIVISLFLGIWNLVIWILW